MSNEKAFWCYINQKHFFIIFRKKCETKFQRICSPYREQNCQTKYEKKCETLTRNKCYEAFKDVPWDTEECKEETVRKCDKHWVTNGGAKEWADNPSTCKNLLETKCYPVTKIRKEPYQQCDKENYQECNDYPREICNWVRKQQNKAFIYTRRGEKIRTLHRSYTGLPKANCTF